MSGRFHDPALHFVRQGEDEDETARLLMMSEDDITMTTFQKTLRANHPQILTSRIIELAYKYHGWGGTSSHDPLTGERR